MRKALSLLLALGAVLVGLAAIQPAQATAPAVAAVTAPAVLEVPAATESAQWTLTGWKMGRLPAASTLCIANGVGGTYPYKYVIEQINNTSWGPNVSVLNRCDGYSIQNRATIDWYTDSTTTCAKFTNTHQSWDAAQGYWVHDQNPVIWYNLSDYCAGSDTPRAHRTAMYVEYIMGLQYDGVQVNAVICATAWCISNVKYVTYEDRRRLGYIYGNEA